MQCFCTLGVSVLIVLSAAFRAEVFKDQHLGLNHLLWTELRFQAGK